VLCLNLKKRGCGNGSPMMKGSLKWYNTLGT